MPQSKRKLETLAKAISIGARHDNIDKRMQFIDKLKHLIKKSIGISKNNNGVGNDLLRTALQAIISSEISPEAMLTRQELDYILLNTNGSSISFMCNEHLNHHKWPKVEGNDPEDVFKIQRYSGYKQLTSVTHSGNYRIRKVVFFGGCITVIPTMAFYRFYDLSYVCLPNNIEYIDQYAFAHCSALEQVDIPSSMKEVARKGFFGCGLRSIHFKQVEKIGSSALANCNQLEYVTLPETLKHLSMYVFKGSKKLKGISHLPKHITVINMGLFWGCLEITSFKISLAVTEIKKWSFRDSGLKSFYIPEGSNVQIRGEAFRDSKSLDIAIPDSVKMIGSGAFLECRSVVFSTLADTCKNDDSSIHEWRETIINSSNLQLCPMVDIHRYISFKLSKIFGSWIQGLTLALVKLPSKIPSLKGLVFLKLAKVLCMQMPELPKTLLEGQNDLLRSHVILGVSADLKAKLTVNKRYIEQDNTQHLKRSRLA